MNKKITDKEKEKMKKNVMHPRTALLVLFSSIILCCLSGCGEVPVESLLLSNTDLTINLGTASALSCTVLPEDATDKTVIWTSSDANIAAVSNIGLITAVNPGTCTITATSGDISSVANITVKKPVDQVVLDKYEISMREEQTFTFTCTIVPNDASVQNAEWTSSDNAIATVDAHGTVTGIKAGSCTVTVTVDGKSATCAVTIKEKAPDFNAIFKSLNLGTLWEVSSDGSYLAGDSNPADLDKKYAVVLYDVSKYTDDVKRINKAMGLPDYLYQDMVSTTWSMGRQEESFPDNGLKITWTYHPDKGLEITYKLLNN